MWRRWIDGWGWDRASLRNRLGFPYRKSFVGDGKFWDAALFAMKELNFDFVPLNSILQDFIRVSWKYAIYSSRTIKKSNNSEFNNYFLLVCVGKYDNKKKLRSLDCQHPVERRDRFSFQSNCVLCSNFFFFTSIYEREIFTEKIWSQLRSGDGDRDVHLPSVIYKTILNERFSSQNVESKQATERDGKKICRRKMMKIFRSSAKKRGIMNESERQKVSLNEIY